MILGEKDDLYPELWQACAGPFVNVPRAGELVLYFAQGHLEQVLSPCTLVQSAPLLSYPIF